MDFCTLVESEYGGLLVGSLMLYKSVLSYCLVCDILLLVDSHIVGVGKPIFGKNHEPIGVLASGHFYNWLEVTLKYYT